MHTQKGVKVQKIEEVTSKQLTSKGENIIIYAYYIIITIYE